MTTVQIAIQDRRYASELYDLLVADGLHYVHLVDQPSPNLPGVVVADENMMDGLTEAQRIDLERYIIFVRQLNFDANRLFSAGVRHVLHAGCSPEVARLIVVAAERRLADAAVSDERTGASNALFDMEDNLFLRSLGIAAVEASLAAPPLQSRDQ